MKKIICEYCDYMGKLPLDNLLIYEIEKDIRYWSYCPSCKIFQKSHMSLRSFFTNKLNPRYSIGLDTLIEYTNRMYDCKKIQPFEVLSKYVGFSNIMIDDLLSRNILIFDTLGCNNNDGDYGMGPILTSSMKLFREYNTKEHQESRRLEQIEENQSIDNIDIDVPLNKL